MYLDVYPFDYEWKVQQYLKNLSDDAIAEVKSSALSHRLCLAQLIKGLACPWGILPAILPSNGKYFPPERYNEFHWFMLTDKTVKLHSSISLSRIVLINCVFCCSGRLNTTSCSNFGRLKIPL